MYNCLVLQLKKVFAFFYNSKLCYCFDTTYFFFFKIISLADTGIRQVLPAWVEWRGNHGSGCSRKEPRSDQQDGRVGSQCFCFPAGPQALQWCVTFYCLGQVASYSSYKLAFTWICARCVFVCERLCCGNTQRCVMSPNGVRGWGNPWRRCMGCKSLLNCGRPGWMESHSLSTDQKVMALCCCRHTRQSEKTLVNFVSY